MNAARRWWFILLAVLVLALVAGSMWAVIRAIEAGT